MIIASDITTLESRGKYQGVLGAMIALANGVGPFLGGLVVQNATWRWVVWTIPLLAAPHRCCHFLFPAAKEAAGRRELLG